MPHQTIPTPHYTLIQTSRAGDPAIVVVNSALRNFKDRGLFPWHLTLVIHCKLLGENGMPTPEEVQILDRLEDEISPLLLAKQNAIFLARITCQGQRELIYRAHDPEASDQTLKQLSSKPSSPREWEYRMEHDDAWAFAQPELKLLERDPRFN